MALSNSTDINRRGHSTGYPVSVQFSIRCNPIFYIYLIFSPIRKAKTVGKKGMCGTIQTPFFLEKSR